MTLRFAPVARMQHQKHELEKKTIDKLDVIKIFQKPYVSRDTIKKVKRQSQSTE